MNCVNKHYFRSSVKKLTQLHMDVDQCFSTGVCEYLGGEQETNWELINNEYELINNVYDHYVI